MIRAGQVRCWDYHAGLGLTVKYFVLSDDGGDEERFTIIVLDANPDGMLGLSPGTQMSYAKRTSLILDSHEVEL